MSVHRPADTAPESSVVTDAAYVSFLGELARTLDVDLIVGSVDYAPRPGGLRAFNAAFVIGPDGVLGPSYDKVHLVPFGEYVPLRRLLFFVERLVQGAIADFTPGERFEPLPTRAGRAATFICYEAIFPELVRRVARRDAAFLVNITNDAWFGGSAAPYQHLAMARRQHGDQRADRSLRSHHRERAADAERRARRFGQPEGRRHRLRPLRRPVRLGLCYTSAPSNRRAPRGVFALGDLIGRARTRTMAKGARSFEIDELVRRVDALKDRFAELGRHL